MAGKVAPNNEYKGSSTKRFKCTCPQAFQDKQYGTNIRIWNKTAKEKEWRCTGCGSARII